MTPSAFKYIGSLYESCIDRGLHLAQIGAELGKHGIRRSPAQVVYELDTVFCFAGYADRHPAPATLTTKQINAG